MENTIPPHDPAGNPLTAYIYTLVDPETNAIRYIGKTTTSLRERLTNHLCEKKDDRKNRWINKLKRQGLKPLIQLIEEVPIDAWRERECYWIAYYHAQGCDLTNTSLGGLGLGYCAPETRAKIAKTLTGRDNGPEFRAKMKEVMAARKGIRRPPEVGAKVSATCRRKRLVRKYGPPGSPTRWN